ncbi:MAG: hypothetical protein ACP5RS_06410 [Thermoplasmata archaeon]
MKSKNNREDENEISYIDPYVKELYNDPLIDHLGTKQFKIEVDLDSLVPIMEKIKNFMKFGVYTYKITLVPSKKTKNAWILSAIRMEYNESKNKWEKSSKI